MGSPHRRPVIRLRIRWNRNAGGGPDSCLRTSDKGSMLLVKRLSFSEVKCQEARRRMAALRRAGRSPQAAAAIQRRASLVGVETKWRITNWKQVARPIARQS